MPVIIYKNSFFATILSLLGIGMCAFGVTQITSSELVFGIFLLVFGVGLCLAARAVAEKKANRKWKNKVRESGLEKEIANDVETAVRVYNTNPGKYALDYIRTLNPYAADFILMNTSEVENN